jgi:hypothetical protein
MPSSSGSLVTATKPKATENFCMVTILLFYNSGAYPVAHEWPEVKKVSAPLSYYINHKKYYLNKRSIVFIISVPKSKDY